MDQNKKRPASESIQAYDLLKKHHKFLRDSDSEDEDSENPSRQKKEEHRGEELAKKYYSKLYKEYALVNLERFEKGQIGCRWRTQKEVLAFKGEKFCGEISCTNSVQNVYEMNFGYVQSGEKKNALVKVSVCKQCAFKLNYKKALKKLK